MNHDSYVFKEDGKKRKKSEEDDTNPEKKKKKVEEPERSIILPSLDEFTSWNEDQLIEFLSHDDNFHVLTFEGTFSDPQSDRYMCSHLQQGVEWKSTVGHEHAQVERDGHGDETICLLIGSRDENQK